MTIRFALFSAAAALAASASMATAQTDPAAGMDDAIAAAKNQLGILEYCQKEGHIEGKAVEVQGKILAMLPPATDTAKVDEAYAKGQAGTVAAMGVEQTIADAATAQSTEPAALCKQLAEMVEQAGAQLPQ